ncbi:hypothetical protein DV451_000179 [Geotrichum candidum]|uniref:Uncharacterized protein n=1 Tax=Geotrichum candidum TaxID=1173061 RepID=A0A0J9XE36_GEOCN|nr:hypothetical protein DV451_000179 [Geotrichum candidum]KAI9213668.1 hypothetical protein DS838_001456 [Geotrichum bryndzae]KAF5105688.1 hypothetical protein DV453_004585 [Geotrichum candidum]KAF5109482.1 hypothetical protein DV454_004989 [Geotrichum candidum]KAF5112529.1 hypothetical protein DV452_004002 [Geotrichum candidum]
MSDRRPNPPGWVPPKAPYNPYDPTDVRPPGGYPSEFDTPGKERSWSIRPKEPENYRVVKDQLKRLQYTPRPLSDLYPGQYKVLRRVESGAFNTGVKYTSFILGTGIVVFGVFFYRWNDGYENVFSSTYRFQLRMRDALFGNLSESQKDDLKPKQRGMTRKSSGNDEAAFIEPSREDSHSMQRPQRMHYIEAERIKQEREEAILRAVDIAEAELRAQKASGVAVAAGSGSATPSATNSVTGQTRSTWKFW